MQVVKDVINQAVVLWNLPAIKTLIANITQAKVSQSGNMNADGRKVVK
jgi:hypothetical protein